MENDEILEQLEADTLHMMVKDLQSALARIEESQPENIDVRFGEGTTEYGPGVRITLTSNQVATAISSYLVAHDVHVIGSRTIRINADMEGSIYVDPSGRVVARGEEFPGRGA